MTWQKVLGNSGATKLENLSDVNSSSPFNNDYLGYDTETNKWISKSFPSGTFTSNQWEGKTWSAVGDSITLGLTLIDPPTTRYTTLVKDALGIFSVNNYGISGTTLAKVDASDTTSMCIRVGSIQNADLITVFGGTNDFTRDVGGTWESRQLGAINSMDELTVYGGLHIICQTLLGSFPNAKYAFFTPLQRSDKETAPSGVITAGKGVNSLGYTLEDVADAILEVAGYYSIPVLDLYRKSGMFPSIEQHKTNYMPDGLHPNIAGHIRLASVVSEFLKTI